MQCKNNVNRGVFLENTGCGLCNRKCRVDRDNGEKGFCGETSEIRCGRAALHMWEEPCISGTRGSGTVFFTGCVLKCVFCQNSVLAESKVGKPVTVSRLAEIFLELQNKGAHNINLVTPTHFVPSIRESIILSKKNGLVVPIVYNTGSYESVDTIKSLEGLVDIYLPDLKYVSSELSKKYSKVPDYFETAKKAINEMVRQTGTPEFDDDGIMKKGVIVRHLLLPGCLSDSKNVIKYLYDTYRDDIFISIMNQYTPMEGIGDKYPELNRKVRKKEYDRLVDYAIDIGVTNGFIQEGGTAKESFIPEFTEEGI